MDAVVRSGSYNDPRSRPASAAKATGVYGGRNVVVPSASTGRCRSSAAMPEAMTPEVLPWSCAVPIVV